MARAKEKAAPNDHRTLGVRSLHRAGVLFSDYFCSWQWKSQVKW